MTQKPMPVQKKGNDFVKAIGDLLILGLLLAAAGFGGYFWGIHQQLAPILKVGAGTPGAVSAAPLPPPQVPQTKETAKAEDSKTTDSTSSEAKHGKKKFWLSSSGVEYIGYSITVKVNDNPVDSFYGPGKNVDVTRYVKHGDNTVTFEAKALGDDYNKHPGDASSILTLNLVAGPSIREDFKKSDVLLSYKRTAAEDQDMSDSMHFSGE